MLRSFLLVVCLLPTFALASPGIMALEDAQRLEHSDVLVDGRIVTVGGLDVGLRRHIYTVVRVTRISGANGKNFKPGLYTFEASCSLDPIQPESPAARGGYPTGHCPGAGMPPVLTQSAGTKVRLILSSGVSGLSWVPAEMPQLYRAVGHAGKTLPKGFKAGLTQQSAP